jgi:hypothetical protein
MAKERHISNGKQMETTGNKEVVLYLFILGGNGF